MKRKSKKENIKKGKNKIETNTVKIPHVLIKEI